MKQSDADDNNDWGDTSEGVCWETGCIDRWERGQQNSPFVGNKREYERLNIEAFMYFVEKDKITVHKYFVENQSSGAGYLQIKKSVYVICMGFRFLYKKKGGRFIKKLLNNLKMSTCRKLTKSCLTQKFFGI